MLIDLTMRVAALYDIHANLPALEAVLADVHQNAVDLIVVGGDVLPGPMPVQTIERLRALPGNVHYIMGNGDREVLAARRGAESQKLPPWAIESIRWNARSLNTGYEQWISSWPKTTSLEIPGLGKALFCHATARDDNEIFTRLTDEARLLLLFANVEADVVVCGHTHMQFDRTIGNLRVVNAGSVGMPFGTPGADWLLLGPGIELRHTNYDLVSAAQRIAATGFPQVPEFDMLKPPPAEKMLELYGRAELK
jgi:putative phosphoesterase